MPLKKQRKSDRIKKKVVVRCRMCGKFVPVELLRGACPHCHKKMMAGYEDRMIRSDSAQVKKGGDDGG